MAGAKRKQYLYDENAPVTAYAKKQVKKFIQEVMNDYKPCTSINANDNTRKTRSNETETDEMSFIAACGTLRLHDQQLHSARFNLEDQSSFDKRTIHNERDDILLDNDQNVNSLYEDLCDSDDELAAFLKEKINPSNSSKSVRNLINDEQFFQSVSLNVNKSPAELLLMVLTYSVSNRLSVSAISNLLKLVNFICGKNVLPETRYNIDQLCNSSNNITLHSICPTCSKYLGTFQDLSNTINCENCDTLVDVSNPSNQCYFAMLDPSNALRNYIEAHGDYYDYVVKKRVHETNVIKDIYDGKMYMDFVKSLNNEDRSAYATVIFNTDGAAVFKSSKFSIWPIYVILNEIPPQARFSSSITVGLWYGLNKPEMIVFLDIFVNMMNNLSFTGITCTIKKEERRIKIYALLSCVDSVARGPMNCTCQFNAYYGCDWCLQIGQYHEGSMRYPFKFPFPQDRNHASTIAHAKQAINTSIPVFGVKTASPLLNLQKFDIIEGFTPDYMHCYLAGVAQQFTSYILRYLTKTDVEYIDELLKTIKSPHQIGRLSRPLKDRENWKAREYENWVLYYTIPVLSTVLKNQRILQHWSLLVSALHICLQANITFSELNRANELLHQFVSQVEDIYSLSALTYNVHQLLHIPKSIYNWGPLHAHSTYPFESANHKLLTAIHCAKGVILQVVRYENIQNCIQLLKQSLDLNNCPVIS